MKRLWPLLLITACTRASEAPPPASLVAEVKRALAERERRLTSFRIEVDTTEGETRAHHEFAFRAPNKSRGHVTKPNEVELAFDGTRLMRVLYPSKNVEVVPLDLPPQDRAYFLASTFMPFAPEGFRAPLLPLSGVEAKRVTRAGKPEAFEAVEVTVKPAPDVTIVYVLRLPAGDFLEKRTLAEGKERVLRVEQERCDEKLALCVPVKLTESLGGQPLGTTEVTKVELNPELPQDWFTPAKGS
ncbi:MAG: LolA family protein [Myxococcota bacterium]